MRNNKHYKQNSIKYSGTPQHLRLMEMTWRLIVEYKKQESRYCIKEEIRSRISATQRTCTFKMFLCCIGNEKITGYYLCICRSTNSKKDLSDYCNYSYSE